MSRPTLPDPAVPADTTTAPAPTAVDGEARPPWRLLVGLGLGVFLLSMPYTGSFVTVLPARIAEIDPANKVSLVATTALSGAIVALLANILFGAISDLTRTRFGKRAPWLVLGAIISAGSLFAAGHAASGTSIVLWWCVYQVGYGAMLAPMSAVIPDRVPQRMRGTYSAAFGTGMIVGAAIGITVGGHLVLNTTGGFTLYAVLVLVAGVVFTALALERSNRHEERATFGLRMFLHHFSFPRHDSRDLYLALGGKLLLVIATYGVTNFQLYLLTDYIKLDVGSAGSLSSLASLVGFPGAILLGVGLGVLSDRLGRRKIFVMGAACLGGIAVLFPFFVPSVWAFLVYAVILSAAQGVYGSVDQALNTEVLPSRETAAKDLGIVNMASSGGMVLGPAIFSVIVNVSGGYKMIFIAAFCFTVVSALLIRPIRKSR